MTTKLAVFPVPRRHTRLLVIVLVASVLPQKERLARALVALAVCFADLATERMLIRTRALLAFPQSTGESELESS